MKLRVHEGIGKVGLFWAKNRSWSRPFLLLVVLTAIIGVYVTGTSEFEKLRLGLGLNSQSIHAYKTSIEKAADVFDYDTAEKLLSFLKTYQSSAVDGEILQLVYPEQKAQYLVSQWDGYLGVHPISYPVVIHKAMLLWQLGETNQAYQAINSLVEVDPNNEEVLSLVKAME